MVAPVEVPTTPPAAPPSGTVSVTRAAAILGVHANTVRTWTELGRLPCLRINARGDRRYRVTDLEAFLELATRRAGRRPVPQEPARRDVELHVLTAIARSIAATTDLEAALGSIARLLRASFGYRAVWFATLQADLLRVRVADGVEAARIAPIGREHGLAGACLAERRPIFVPDVSRDPRYVVDLPQVVAEMAVPVFIDGEPWGVLVVGADRPDTLGPDEADLLQGVVDQVAVAVRNLALVERVRRQLGQAEALRRIGADLSSKLDLEVILSDLIDHAALLFAADRAVVLLREADGTLLPRASRGLSERFLAALRVTPGLAGPGPVVAGRRAAADNDWSGGPQDPDERQLVAQEGLGSVAAAPLVSGSDGLGLLALYRDPRQPWDQPEVDVLEALTAQAGVAIANARNYARTATWAAQLQSIQKLGARLTSLSKVRDIGLAICGELNQLIDYHNVRVYVVEGHDLVPIAWHGEIGEYADEAEEQLRLEVGQGITGWVAQHGLAQYLPDADSDPRTQTITGTQEHLAESLLVAPMKVEDRVLGVVVLSKLGLHRFSADDLRLLEIYGSLAAQALRTAAATEGLHAQSAALERRVRNQQELLSLTEAIITTRDQATLLQLVVDRLGRLLEADSILVDLHDAVAHHLTSLIALGPHADAYRGRHLADDQGLSGWVMRHGEAQLLTDGPTDPRVVHLDGASQPRCLIAAPLRGRDQVVGVLTLERVGAGRAFSQEEFELVQLLAAQASVGLQNAQAHHAVALQAQTDGLTNLSNHTTFHHQLRQAVERGEPFSVLMIDLDEFKAYNDTFGHQAGDAMLSQIATALVLACRETDAVFRYGGDEFTILLPGTDQAGGLAVAEKVRAAVTSAGHRTGHRDLHLTCSIGVASFPRDATEARDLLFAADRAAYLSKRTGRDLVSTAAMGAELAAGFLPTPPTPVDEPVVALPRRAARRPKAVSPA